MQIYLSWHWTVIQNFNKPWPCRFKNGMYELGEHSLEHWKSKKLCDDGFFLSKACNASEESCVMTLKGDPKIKGNLTHFLKNYIMNLVNLHMNSWESGNLHFGGFLLSKPYKDLDEKVKKRYVWWHQKVMQSFQEKWLLVPKMTWRNWWSSMRAVTSLEIWTLMQCCFCQWHIKFQLKKYRRNICHDTGKRSKLWAKTDLLESSGKSQNMHLDGLFFVEIM